MIGSEVISLWKSWLKGFVNNLLVLKFPASFDVKLYSNFQKFEFRKWKILISKINIFNFES